MSPRIATLRGDRRGVAAVEFALVAPVLLTFMVGSFDLAHALYMTTTLQGAVQKTARDSSLQNGTDMNQQTALDDRVRASVRAIAPNATVTITRRYFRTYAAAAAKTPEPFPGGNDTNKNGKCDNNEVFVDTNGNGFRDLDGGDGGQGTAKDRTVYTVAISMPRLFPIYRYIGGKDTFDTTAVTILANQPYDTQGSYGAPKDGHCP